MSVLKNTINAECYLQSSVDRGEFYITRSIIIIRPRENKKRRLKVGIAAMHSINFCALLRDRLMVGQRPLEPRILVRIQVPQQCAEKVWRGEVGQRPLEPRILVRIQVPQPE